jgi:hypothetical protein
MPTAGPLDLFRPLLWIATAAFLLGFAGFLVVDGGRTVRASRLQASISPSTADEVIATRL